MTSTYDHPQYVQQALLIAEQMWTGGEPWAAEEVRYAGYQMYYDWSINLPPAPDHIFDDEDVRLWKQIVAAITRAMPDRMRHLTVDLYIE